MWVLTKVKKKLRWFHKKQIYWKYMRNRWFIWYQSAGRAAKLKRMYWKNKERKYSRAQYWTSSTFSRAQSLSRDNDFSRNARLRKVTKTRASHYLWQQLQTKRPLRIPVNSFMFFGDKIPNSNEMKNERAAHCSVRVTLELSVTTVDAGTTVVKRRRLRNEVKRSMHNQTLV